MTVKYLVQTDKGSNIPVEVMRFPSGEVAVKLVVDAAKPFSLEKVISVLVQGYEADTLFVLANIKDALDELLRNAGLKGIHIRLFLTYMPHARYDRHMVAGDGFALRVFCDMLNLMHFDQILVVDPHSDATTALLRNCTAIPQDEVVMDMLTEFGWDIDVLVAPDAGAYKKIFKLAQKLKKPVVTLTKVRNLETGEILGTELVDKLPVQAHCLIVDDLCDGGRTFIGAAECLRKAGARSVELAVSHGIFSQGVEKLLDNGIDRIYTTDSFAERESTDKVHVYKYF